MNRNFQSTLTQMFFDSTAAQYQMFQLKNIVGTRIQKENFAIHCMLNVFRKANVIFL
jgi:hypothetical protein